MILNLERNPLYEKWLEDHKYEETIAYGPVGVISRKDLKPAWTDSKGQSFNVFTEQHVWGRWL